MNNTSWDSLNILTKEEIITFLKVFYPSGPPSERYIKYLLWRKNAEDLQSKMHEHMINNNSVELCEQMDEYAIQFNAETDIDKKILLAQKMLELKNKIRAINAEWQKLNQMLADNDKLNTIMPSMYYTSTES